MGTLKLRNCTRFDLTYHKILAFSSNHYVKPGEESAEIHWSATYTLRVERAKDSPNGSNIRAAVNPNGTYYAVWKPDQVLILGEDQIGGYSEDDNNPYIAKWIGASKDVQLPIEWHQIASRQSSTSPQSFTVEEVVGFSHSSSSTSSFTVETTNTVGLEVGTSFSVKEIDISGSVSASSSSTSTSFHETMTREDVYRSTKETRTFNLAAGESMVIWQPAINVFGHMVYINHLAYTKINEGPPEYPKFDPVKASLMTWK